VGTAVARARVGCGRVGVAAGCVDVAVFAWVDVAEDCKVAVAANKVGLGCAGGCVAVTWFTGVAGAPKVCVSSKNCGVMVATGVNSKLLRGAICDGSSPVGRT